ncbi:MAG: alcohol dehydrogenase family protein [Pseudomonadota bacterium]
MRAVVLHGHGGLDQLTLHTDWPTPAPGPEDVLIEVHACGMNNTDVNTRSGWYSKAVSDATTGDAYETVDEDDPTWGGAPITFPRIQGADACGVVVAVGEKVDASLVGKRVITDNWLRDWAEPMNRDAAGYFGSEADGGYAEYCVIDHRNARPIESDLSSAELATFSCSYSTAEGMLQRAGVTSDDTVLVTGASGGVGSAVIQLAKMRGARVVALASPGKHESLRALGADILLDRAPDDLAGALEASTGRPTVEVVADIVGGTIFPALIDILARGGRYTCSGAIAGPLVSLDLRTFYLNDLTFTGSTVIAPSVMDDLVGYIETGALKPLVAATYPLEAFHAGQAAFIEKQHVGNFVVAVQPSS